jgi:hypothetical protein
MAGLLGEIFSTADTAKRKLRDVAANPLLSAQQALGNINDRARNLNEMTAAAAMEGVEYGPASQRLGGLLADAYGPVGMTMRAPGKAFDPRFDARAKEQERLSKLTTDVTERVTNVPQVSLANYAGRPFITSMADRTGVGMLNKINDVQLNRPVNMQGGQPFMFDNPGQVWASAAGPSRQILQEAEIIKQVTGQNPLFLPWRMAPTGGDFASMTGETMLSYADAAMTKTNKKRLDKMIKGYIPEWSGVSSDKAAEQFRAAPDRVRKALKNAMDVEFRDAGGLNIGEARLAVADPFQLTSRDTGLLSVGEVFADKPLIAKSGHAAYPKGVPGQGLGQLKEDISIFELMPNVVQARGIPDPKNPRATDIRALQMKPYAGVLTDELLKRLGY